MFLLPPFIVVVLFQIWSYCTLSFFFYSSGHFLALPFKIFCTPRFTEVFEGYFSTQCRTVRRKFTKVLTRLIVPKFLLVQCICTSNKSQLYKDYGVNFFDLSPTVRFSYMYQYLFSHTSTQGFFYFSCLYDSV